ncbi:aldo/keto reductase [Spirochaetia bacterium]|nr:aldo/keto reductase [Spirochaetia bacterium]
MKYRQDLRSGRELSALGFGCMRFPKVFGGAIDIKKTDALIMDAIKNGVNYFDTAWMYPGSEDALGTILANNGARKQVYIATKLPVLFCKNGADFDRYFNESLKRLKTDYIDYYLMHMLTDFASWEKLKSFGIENWITQKKKSGEIKQIGFSFHGSLGEFIKILNDYDWEFCQIQYNYSDENYQAGVGGLKAAAAKKIPVIIMEPLLGGKLANNLPNAASQVFNKANPARSVVGWALGWLWDQSEVTVVLSGMSTQNQLTENLAIAQDFEAGCLTENDRAVYLEVKNVFNASYKIHCTGCNYCMPCPKGVNIPGCFSAYNSSYLISHIEGFKQYLTSTAATSVENHCASMCVECGKCEEHCPQHLPIRNNIKAVRRRLEPLYFRFILSVTRGVLKLIRSE